MVLEQKFTEEVVLPELDQQKQKLKNLRNFYQPVHTLGLDKHSKNYDFVRREMETEIHRNREMQMRSLQDHVNGFKYKPHLAESTDN